MMDNGVFTLWEGTVSLTRPRCAWRHRPPERAVSACETVPMPDARLTRRTALAAVVLTTTSACRLRVEKDAPLPGPTAAPAPDSGPLEAVRRHLVVAMSAASQETNHRREAADARGAHVAELKRLDATLRGIGATSLPSVSATAAPSVSASASASPSASASGKSSRASVPASSPSASSSPAATAWTRAESDWASPALCASLQKVSSTSRPLALSIAARGLSSLPGGVSVPWSATASVPSSSALLEANAVTIHALEWWAARTDPDDRGDVPDLLDDLYAVRSLAESSASSGSPSSSSSASASPAAPARRYDSLAAARADAGKAAAAVMSACAVAATGTRSADDVNGLLLAWSSAARTVRFGGGSVSPFPGLTT